MFEKCVTLFAALGLLCSSCVDYPTLLGAADGGGPQDGGADGGGNSDGGDGPAGDCPIYIGALAGCAFQYLAEADPASCPETICLDRPCSLDGDCALAGSLDAGGLCVTGNCVYCALAEHCPAGTLCRAGRCVGEADACPGPPPCEGNCRPIDPSERPCVQCACETLFAMPCVRDLDCLVLSSHPYRRCLYGRCAECRHDGDCDQGRCLPPGLCGRARPHPGQIYGAWLVGWPAGMDHYSYLRFEADGTLRRARYEMRDGPFADDILNMEPCPPDEEQVYPLLGNWEVDRQPGVEGLHLRLILNSACATTDPVFTSASFSEDGARVQFSGDDTFFDGYRIPAGACSEDFSLCPHPEDLPIWP